MSKDLLIRCDLVATGITKTVEQLEEADLDVDESLALYLWAYNAMLNGQHPAFGPGLHIPRISTATRFLASYRGGSAPLATP